MTTFRWLSFLLVLSGEKVRRVRERGGRRERGRRKRGRGERETDQIIKLKRHGKLTPSRMRQFVFSRLLVFVAEQIPAERERASVTK